MPTYGYQCPGCGHEFDRLQKITDDTRAKCPECGKRAKRLISGGAGIVFKGSGFYETDYKRADRKTSQSESGESPGKTDGASDKKDKPDKTPKATSPKPAKDD